MDDAEEMGAYMKQLLEYYLVGPQYSGYSGVKFINTTYVYFTVIREPTPVPTGDGTLATGTTADTQDTAAIEVAPLPFYEEYFNYLLYGGGGLIVICCCLFICIYYCCAKQRKIKAVKYLIYHMFAI